MIHLSVFFQRLKHLPALIFWFIKDVYKYFKNHEGKHFHQWGLHIYLGKLAPGKPAAWFVTHIIYASGIRKLL